MSLTKSEHSKKKKKLNTSLMPLENTTAITRIPCEPKVLFSHCDLGVADTPMERKTGTPS